MRFRTGPWLRAGFQGRIVPSSRFWGRFATPAQGLLMYAPLTPVLSVEQCSTQRPLAAVCDQGRVAVPTEKTTPSPPAGPPSLDAPGASTEVTSSE